MSGRRRSSQAPGPAGDERGTTFFFAGRRVDAVAGQSVAGALYAAGIRRLNRSVKYRRPRALYCAGGYCPNCLVRVGAVPYVRSCVTEVTEGLVVEPLGRHPATRPDPLRVLDWCGRLFPLGFQYRYFKGQGRAYAWWERRLRATAGHARLPGAGTQAPGERVTADLAVLGAGPAGLAAAEAAAGAGLRVVLVSRRSRLGGRAKAIEPTSSAGREMAAVLQRLSRLENARVVAPATAVAVFGTRIVVDRGARAVEVDAPYAVLATGAYERGLLFEGNDTPGVMLSSAAARLATEEGVVPGRRAVVVCCDDSGMELAELVRAAGVDVVGIYDQRPEPAAPREHVRYGHHPIRAHGRNWVTGLTVEGPGGRRTVACDLVLMSGGWQAADELQFIATSEGQVLVEGSRATSPDVTDPPGTLPAMQCVGAVVGARTTTAALAQGAIAGLLVARAQGRPHERALDAARRLLETAE